MDVFEDRLELVGVGALPSRTIPLSRYGTSDFYNSERYGFDPDPSGSDISNSDSSGRDVWLPDPDNSGNDVSDSDNDGIDVYSDDYA